MPTSKSYAKDANPGVKSALPLDENLRAVDALPFVDASGRNQAIGTTTAAKALPTAPFVTFVVEAANGAFLRLGASNVTCGSTDGTYTIRMPGAVSTIMVPRGVATHVAVITTTGTGTLYISGNE
jgi:hypothetical protein